MNDSFTQEFVAWCNLRFSWAAARLASLCQTTGRWAGPFLTRVLQEGSRTKRRICVTASLIVLALVAGAILLSSCHGTGPVDSSAANEANVLQPRDAQAQVVRPRLNLATSQPESEKLETILNMQSLLDAELDLLLEELSHRFSERELSELQTLRRIYGTAQFLKEFRRWASLPEHKELMTPEDLAEIVKIEEKWNALEFAVAAIGAEERTGENHEY